MFDNQKRHCEPRVNDRIRISPILVIKEGENLGVMPTEKALKMAREAGLDLVEVVANKRPPVCRIMDYSKFKYEQKLREKQQKKHSKANQMKSIRFRPVTDDHDVEIKLRSIRQFLEDGHQVQLKLEFKGKREFVHRDRGIQVIRGIIERVSEIGTPQFEPRLQGRFIHCILDPKSKR